MVTALGLADTGARLLGAAATQVERHADPPDRNRRDRIERCTAAARQALGDDGYRGAFAAGRRLSFAAAMTMAANVLRAS